MCVCLLRYMSFSVYLSSKPLRWGTTASVQTDCREYGKILVMTSYKELFPRCQLYNTKAQLKKLLKDACLRPQTIRSLDRRERAKQYSKYLWNERKKDWDAILYSYVS